MEKTRTRFRNNKVNRRLDPLKIEDNSFNEKFEHNVNDIVVDYMDEEKKTDQDMSDATVKKDHKHSGTFDRTSDMDSQQVIPIPVVAQLRPPYEFIGIAKAPIHTIILPHFTFKSITFSLTVLMTFMFVGLFIVSQTRPQSPTSWGCLLFEAQNKFYPRLKENYQLWRVPVSGLFHSNFSHLILNLVGMQLYGYFVQWYIGKWRFAILLVASVINGHFLSCLTERFTVSTSASSMLYAILAIKALFFIKYRHYEPLDSKRKALYGLLALIFGMNIIVLFVGGNVDIGGHVGGFVTGLVFGGIFYEFDLETKLTKGIRFGLVGVSVAISLALVGAAYGIQDKEIANINAYIDTLC